MLSPLALEHVQHPRNSGPLESPTHVGTCGVRGDGPYVRITMRIEGGRIKAAHYETYGCPSSIAASSLTAQLAIGRTPEEASRLTGEDLLIILGGLPEGKEQCAQMAATALRNAL